MSETYYNYAETPLGKLLLVGEDDALVGLYVADHPSAPHPEDDWVPDEGGRLDKAIDQLQEYFGGQRQEFDLITRPSGTNFQQEVWSALTEIPYGETASYGEIAESIGRPQASRAVGAANGQNPVSIVIPCHRVIGSDGRPTGYGWGIPRKMWLLEHEQGRTPLTAPVT